MWRMSRTVASAPSRSALLTTKMSPISRMPALAAWMPSPMPGASSTMVVSARPATSTSDCPTPTVSTRITSQPGGVEHAQRLRGGPGEPAEVAAAGHRADVDVGVERVVLHPHPVTEQRAAGERRRRVDGEDADPLALLAKRADEGVGGGGLADARGCR